MAKVVSTKFGDRRLVYLPPINLKGVKTPNVETIETDRQVPDSNRNAETMAIVPKEYAYNKRPVGGRNAWLGAPVRSTLEGNIVTEYPNAIGDQIFQQLYQQAKTDSLGNYGEGQFPVLPPVGESPGQMQYTNYGLHNVPPPQPPPLQQAAQPEPVPQQPNQGPNPNEKHIYYGPNGEVLPGPPQSLNKRGRRDIPQDFAFEGLLNFGRLKAITLIESNSGFPKMPDYLIKDLLEKYGQYEQTIVRVVSRLGRCHVHATPKIRQIPQFQAPVKPKYVPVYLEEDEEFDYDKFMRDYEKGYIKSPNHAVGNQFRGPSRKFVHRSDALRPKTYDDVENFRRQNTDYRYGDFSRRQPWSTSAVRQNVHPSDALRPNTYDNIENLRWHKADDRYRTASRRQPWSPPVSRKSAQRSHSQRPDTYDDMENLRWRKTEKRYGTVSRRTAPSRAEMSWYRSARRNQLETRDDIKTIEMLDRYHLK